MRENSALEHDPFITKKLSDLSLNIKLNHSLQSYFKYTWESCLDNII